MRFALHWDPVSTAVANDPYSVSAPVGTFIAMVVALGVSVFAYKVVVWRATTHRRWVALSEWSRENDFRMHLPAAHDPPAPLDRVAGCYLRHFLTRSRGRTALVQFGVDPVVAKARRERVRQSMNPTGKSWNVLVRAIESDWRPTGLRPVDAPQSVLDFFGLSSFPNMTNNNRFMVHGNDSAAARGLAKSMVRGLLPKDVGLLLIGRYLVLDFSNRPFDDIEFDRIRGLADQIVAHLPPPV